MNRKILKTEQVFQKIISMSKFKSHCLKKITCKDVSIANYERNANQNFKEVSPHTSHNGHRRQLQTISAGEGVEQREPSYTDAGNGSWEQPRWRTQGSSLAMKMRMRLECSLTPYTKINSE